MGETEELSTEAWKSVLQKLREANIPQVTFTGGEPTLEKGLGDFCAAVKDFYSSVLAPRLH